MFVVPTFLAPSLIHGLGVFATENICKGSVVQAFNPEFDCVYDEKEMGMNTTPKIFRDYVYHFAYKKASTYVLLSDNARFLNHSFCPNLGSRGIDDDLALRDIEKNEELTVNYYDFDDDADFKLGNSNDLKIFTVTAVRGDPKNSTDAYSTNNFLSRPIACYTTYELALEGIDGDIRACWDLMDRLYEFVVISSINSGFTKRVKELVWYKIAYDQNGTYSNLRELGIRPAKFKSVSVGGFF